MTTDRLLHLYEVLARHERSDAPEAMLSRATTDFLGVTETAIVLSDAAGFLVPFSTSGAVARRIIDDEMVTGEGPCTQVIAQDIVVLAPHLRTSQPSQWLHFSPRALEHGAEALFGFPLRIDGLRLGALLLVITEPGSLTDDVLADAQLMASVVGPAILALQREVPREGVVAALQRDEVFDYAVYQAAGMLMVQGDFSIEASLDLLRARAYGTDSMLSDVAQQVVARTLRYDPSGNAWLREDGVE